MIRLFRVFVPSSVLGLLVSELLLIYACYIAGAYCLYYFISAEFDPSGYLLYDGGLVWIGLVAGCVMLGIYFHDLYTKFRIKSRILLVQQLCLVLGIAFLTQALLTYLKHPEWTLPRWVMIFGSTLTLVFLPLWRIFYANVLLKALGYRRVLFLGTSAASRDVAAHMGEHPELGFVPIGFIDNTDGNETLPGASLLGQIGDLRSVVEAVKPDRIVVGMTERRQRLPVLELLDLRFAGIHIEDVLYTYEATFGRICTRELRPSQLIFTAELGPRRGQVMLQLIYSIAIALVLIVLTLPIMILVGIAVRLTSSGPALHRQRRVGRNGTTFVLYKFRSMRKDAEAATGAVWAQKNDPRVTPLGRWLRLLRIDEMPQLFNVIRGEMSLVGPRPERPEFVETLSEQIPYYRQRHCVRPGITGWAQINHKYGDTLEDTIIKLEYDLYYIKNLAVTLDTYIMFHTLKVMLLSRGAQ